MLIDAYFSKTVSHSFYRTLANYVGWRIIQASVFLLGEEIRQIYLDFETISFGKEDFEQRFKSIFF